jgi:flagellar biosynthetic protein FliQ
MTPDIAIDLFRKALTVALLLSAPLLGAGLVIGVVVSTFQAVTQIHEMTLSFVPKVVVVSVVLILVMPWMARTLLEFSSELLGGLAGYGH